MQFGNAQDTIKQIICQIITLAPGMKQDKPGSCSQYENYQRPEGFPGGKRNKMKKVKNMMFCQF